MRCHIASTVPWRTLWGIGRRQFCWHIMTHRHLRVLHPRLRPYRARRGVLHANRLRQRNRGHKGSRKALGF
jgi:hypothetical protein